MRCDEVVKREVRTVSPDETVQAAAAIMRDANIGFLPVCDPASGLVQGTLTDRDIAVRVVAENHPSTTSVGLVMSRGAVTCRPEDDLQIAEERMKAAQVSRIVCTDESGRPVGVMSLSDIAEVEEGERAAEVLRAVAARESKQRAA